MSKCPIGVFDSGVGGLSVLRALRAELPYEHFVYVADSGHAPYGERDDAYLIERARAIAQWFKDRHHIKALVVACNTATAAAIHVLREAHTDIPIIGIEPALKPAVLQSTTKVIGVMATRSTLASEKFKRLMTSLEDQARFLLQPCPDLVPAIEAFDSVRIQTACAHYASALGRFGLTTGHIDTLVLGCTHYPFAEDALRRTTGNAVKYLDGGEPVARQTRRLLEAAQLLYTSREPHVGTTTLFSSGEPASLAIAAQRWLGLHSEALMLAA
ncbi:MAG: glutamate racemase [Rhodoferax sp.]|nr:glutamate racemase [Rhodoferax sp.]